MFIRYKRCDVVCLLCKYALNTNVPICKCVKTNKSLYIFIGILHEHSRALPIPHYNPGTLSIDLSVNLSVFWSVTPAPASARDRPGGHDQFSQSVQSVQLSVFWADTPAPARARDRAGGHPVSLFQSTQFGFWAETHAPARARYRTGGRAGALA